MSWARESLASSCESKGSFQIKLQSSRTHVVGKIVSSQSKMSTEWSLSAQNPCELLRTFVADDGTDSRGRLAEAEDMTSKDIQGSSGTSQVFVGSILGRLSRTGSRSISAVTDRLLIGVPCREEEFLASALRVADRSLNMSMGIRSSPSNVSPPKRTRWAIQTSRSFGVSVARMVVGGVPVTNSRGLNSKAWRLRKYCTGFTRKPRIMRPTGASFWRL
mmetsp:Transcript_67509/g.124228  ORF Transcript_67509/g.124228 Transcript_67509/m.124228 type:complete len:218 (-) Transcript_67509:365-1018(-)